MPAGPARLAARDRRADRCSWTTRSPRTVGACASTRRSAVSGRDEVPAATQRMADGFAADIAAHPADWHMMQKLWLADLPDDASARGAREAGGGVGVAVRIGIVCPYSFEVPGGVQGHVVDLAQGAAPARPPGRRARARRRGHPAARVRPARGPRGRHPVQRLGRAAVVRAGVLRAGAAGGSARHDFDVLHLHEPTAPSLAMLALMRRRRPDRGHLPHRPPTAPARCRRSRRCCSRSWRRSPRGSRCPRSPAGCRSSTSAATRWRSRTAWTSSSSRRAQPLPGYPREGGTIGFVGRFTEPRKGMPVLLDALRLLVPDFPELRLVVVGGGDQDELRRAGGSRARRPPGAARPGRRRGEGADAAPASTCTARRTPAARASG